LTFPYVHEKIGLELERDTVRRVDMKVHELIAILSQRDPDDIVLLVDDEGNQVPLTEVHSAGDSVILVDDNDEF